MVDRVPNRLMVDYHQDWTLTKLSGGTLVSGANDSIVKIWDESQGTIQRKISGHTGEITR